MEPEFQTLVHGSLTEQKQGEDLWVGSSKEGSYACYVLGLDPDQPWDEVLHSWAASSSIGYIVFLYDGNNPAWKRITIMGQKMLTEETFEADPPVHRTPLHIDNMPHEPLVFFWNLRATQNNFLHTNPLISFTSSCFCDYVTALVHLEFLTSNDASKESLNLATSSVDGLLVLQEPLEFNESAFTQLIRSKSMATFGMQLLRPKDQDRLFMTMTHAPQHYSDASYEIVTAALSLWMELLERRLKRLTQPGAPFQTCSAVERACRKHISIWLLHQFTLHSILAIEDTVEQAGIYHMTRLLELEAPQYQDQQQHTNDLSMFTAFLDDPSRFRLRLLMPFSMAAAVPLPQAESQTPGPQGTNPQPPHSSLNATIFQTQPMNVFVPKALEDFTTSVTPTCIIPPFPKLVFHDEPRSPQTTTPLPPHPHQPKPPQAIEQASPPVPMAPEFDTTPRK